MEHEGLLWPAFLTYRPALPSPAQNGLTLFNPSPGGDHLSQAHDPQPVISAVFQRADGNPAPNPRPICLRTGLVFRDYDGRENDTCPERSGRDDWLPGGYPVEIALPVRAGDSRNRGKRQ